MDANIRKYMKIGIIHFMAYPSTIKGEGPILETAQKIAQDPYFDLVEVTWVKDAANRKALKDVFEQAGIEVKYGAQPRLLTTGLDLNSADESIRQKAIATVKEGVDEAIEIGSTSIAFLSGKNVEKDREAAKSRLLDSIIQICKYADSKKKAFPVALEIFDHLIDKKALIGPANDAVDVAEAVKKECNNFGLLADLSHLPLIGETPALALRPIKKHLVHIHIGNCIMRDKNQVGYGDQHPRFGVAGGENGVPQLVEFLRELIKIGYLDGKTPKPVSFEVKPLPGESSEIVIANAKRALEQAWALV
ncbi:MAG: TIM barrel protein [Candidatus Thermoplasmatota archaeon]|nr:TIM barrel protein [Candidatus Thermoplasmatota archaeon]